jgi:D-alanyl-lipoteichoic acid acyltransferase DltB (MBOAT superfamily)
MLFNSYTFLLLFLPATLTGCFWLADRWGVRAAMLWLTVASFFFYGWWDARYVPLLASSVAFNYGGCARHRAARGPIRPPDPRPRRSPSTSVSWATSSTPDSSPQASTPSPVPGLDFGQVVLPLGISFFTFTQIAYLVDVYRDPVRYGFCRTRCS